MAESAGSFLFFAGGWLEESTSDSSEEEYDTRANSPFIPSRIESLTPSR